MSGLQIVGMVFVLMFVLVVVLPMIVFRKCITLRQLGSMFNPFGKFGAMISIMAVFRWLSLAVAVGALFDERWLALSCVTSVVGFIMAVLFVIEMLSGAKRQPATDDVRSFSWKGEVGAIVLLLFLGSATFLNNYVLGLV